jgi:hypothetical protein
VCGVGLSNRRAVLNDPRRMLGRRLVSVHEPSPHAGRHVKPPGGSGPLCVCAQGGFSRPLAGSAGAVKERRNLPRASWVKPEPLSDRAWADSRVVVMRNAPLAVEDHRMVAA